MDSGPRMLLDGWDLFVLEAKHTRLRVQTDLRGPSGLPGNLPGADGLSRTHGPAALAGAMDLSSMAGPRRASRFSERAYPEQSPPLARFGVRTVEKARHVLSTASRLPAAGRGEPIAHGTPQRLAAGEARTHAPEEDDSVC